MYELGYERDWQQCDVKIKNLKSIYRDINNHNGETGRGRKACKFYRVTVYPKTPVKLGK